MGATWDGARYYRKSNRTWRDSNTGNLYDKDGRPLGNEENRKHFYGGDPKPKKFKGIKRKIKIKKIKVKVRKK